jgi:ADP-heptose:LPS heptosyltransferase
MLQGLKKKYPDCGITFFTASEMSDLIADNPDVDEVVSIPEKKYRYYLKNKPEYYARIYNEMHEVIFDLKERRFQMIINRHYEFGGILAHLIGAEQILGQVISPEGGSFLNDPISVQLYDAILTNRKANRRNLADWACRIAGLEPGCGRMYFAVPEIDLWQAERLLAEYSANNDNIIAVQIGAAKSFRQWGADNYFHIIKWLIEEKERKVVLLGAEDEREQADIIRLRIGKANQGLIDLTGKTDFKTLGGILKKCRQLITGDTGTMHMAAAVGTQVIALFYGTAFPWETGPYGTGHLVLYADEECAPCLRPEDCNSNHSCRKAITPEHVCEAFEISEAVKENRIADVGFSPEKLKLYLTYAKPGADQTLVDINEINKTNDYRITPHGSGTENHTGSADNFLNKKNRLLQKLCRGDIEGFMDLFSGYIDRWIKLLSFIKDKNFDKNVSDSLVQCLYPALNEAARAMQAQDYSALADLIQHDFNHASDLFTTLLTGTSSHTACEFERRLMQ